MRPQDRELARRLAGPRRFLQVVAGPRQVGKTTLVRQVLGELGLSAVQASADEPAPRGRGWIEQQWEAARLLAPSFPRIVASYLHAAERGGKEEPGNTLAGFGSAARACAARSRGAHASHARSAVAPPQGEQCDNLLSLRHLQVVG